MNSSDSEPPYITDEAQWKERLRTEGFENVFVWRDYADVYYERHTHPFDVAHAMLEGEMEIIMEGVRYPLKAGDRLDVPAWRAHSARVGPEGCQYIIGKRFE